MRTTRLYHLTTVESLGGILAEGFRDASGSFATGRAWRGVWLTDDPAAGPGPHGETGNAALLAIDLDVSARTLEAFEWLPESTSHSRWLVPAHWLNEHAERIVAPTESTRDRVARPRTDRTAMLAGVPQDIGRCDLPVRGGAGRAGA